MASIQSNRSGLCWCGCGVKTNKGRLFLPGHDRRAESAVIKRDFGGVQGFLRQRGYGPESGQRNPVTGEKNR